jgi:SAM-dependent methyltransferase
VPDAIRGRQCLVVGCGLGDDAEYMAEQGGHVTAFDLSETAIQWCHRRFPQSDVRYVAANLLAPPAEWTRHFDVIFEANTLQAMPADLRVAGMRCIAQFLKPGGRLLVVCRGREPDDPLEGPPWPLVRTELDAFTESGLAEASFADVVDARDDARRFVIEYRLLPRHH